MGGRRVWEGWGTGGKFGHEAGVARFGRFGRAVTVLGAGEQDYKPLPTPANLASLHTDVHVKRGSHELCASAAPEDHKGTHPGQVHGMWP